MNVRIEVSGAEEKHEYQFACQLRSVFEKGLPKRASGSISIASSVQLFGQNPRDVDIVVFGVLDDAYFDLPTTTKQSPDDYRKRRIWLNSFCFTIETKEHSSAGVEMRGTSLVVKYGQGKVRDATVQSEDQKYSLRNYLATVAPGAGVWICNFLWMKNLSVSTITGMTRGRPHNILPDRFSLAKLLSSAFLQTPPIESGNSNQCHISALYSRSNGTARDVFRLVNDVLTSPRQAAGALTRKNVERIVGKEIHVPDELAQALGKKLVIVSGRAGTGKTVKMLRMGCELSSDKGRRCLFLTYNRALVDDIRRTLFFADIPTDFDEGCVAVMTIHEFTRKLAIALGLISSDEYSPQKHLGLCTEIAECIEAQAITQEDIVDLMRERHELACWDHVFIDEAQDFGEAEKFLLCTFFGYSKLVIADGIDQFVRGAGKLDWGKNIYVVKTVERRCLRQKKNLATFVNDYASAMEVKWQVEPLPELLGGKVIISNELFPFDTFRQSRKMCLEQGNKPFEMLFLVPPYLVAKEGGEKRFSYLEYFQQEGFSLWDGTRSDRRSSGFPSISQHRLYQYESCRGLEGWCVVCLGFDKLIEQLAYTFARNDKVDAVKFGLVAMDSDEAKKQLIGLRSIIPLTRAIDTLIITLADPKSDAAEALKRCSHEDYVETIGV